MMIKWVPVNEVEIPEIENPGFSEDVIIREPIAMVKKEKIETVKDVKKDESNEIFADFDLFGDIGDDDATVILNAGDDEPTILLKKTYAYVKRLKTNELIMINQDEFILGKGSKADYIVANNPAISRNHALIYQEDDSYYLKDLNSSNHTFVDEEVLEATVKLEDGMQFKLADEYFQFFLIEEA